MKKRYILYVFISCVLLALFFHKEIGTAITYIEFSFPKKNIENSEKLKNQISKKDFLHIDGDSIYKKSGDKVVLKGVNLGGWLMQEYWMCPSNMKQEKWTNLDLILKLEERFGKEKTQKLIELYQKNWITERDLQTISKTGCNVIRVPFSYYNFMTEDGEWKSGSFEESPGVQTLDWLIETAGKYGVYVILDMHTCPGGQSAEHVAGLSYKYELFSSEKNIELMEQLWVALADRYKDNPVVAAYDIMNEALVYDNDITVETDPRNMVYDRMISAIRKVDPSHIITVEGIWSLSCLPLPQKTQWSQVMYQVHLYGGINIENSIRELEQYRKNNKIPIYVGECANLDLLKACINNDLHCTTWTYKGTNYADGDWYMFQRFNNNNVNIDEDPYWLIKLKWGSYLNTQFFSENTQITDTWKEINN